MFYSIFTKIISIVFLRKYAGLVRKFKFLKMFYKGKRDQSAETRPKPGISKTPNSNIIDLIRKLNENHKEIAKKSTNTNDEQANKTRANSLPRGEEYKGRITSSKPPICRKPSLGGLNQTEDLKNKLPPKVPLSNTRAVSASYLKKPAKDEIIGTGNIEDYLIGSQVGQGAYAVVRSAIHKISNKKIALKTYEKVKLLDPHRKRCVQREIDILKILNHQNIVKLYEVIDTSKNLHLAMEFIGGTSLHGYLKRRPNRRLEESEANRVFKQILHAINYCHGKNVTHRDIKLENILLDDENNVKIIDFGFGTCFSHEKKVKLFCGTPSYMAPEIVSRVEYSGPPADVWALGVLLYVLLCGAYPFKAQYDKELYKKIQYGQFTVPNNISAGARSLITRIMRLNPDKRPTVNDILKDNWIVSNDFTKPSEVVPEPLPKASSTGDPFDAEIIFSLVKNI